MSHTYATATLSLFLGPLPILHLDMKEGMYLAVDSLTQGEPRKLDLPHQAHASVSVPCVCGGDSRGGERASTVAFRARLFDAWPHRASQGLATPGARLTVSALWS
mgnify:CR=1 FL=1